MKKRIVSKENDSSRDCHAQLKPKIASLTDKRNAIRTNIVGGGTNCGFQTP